MDATTAAAPDLGDQARPFPRLADADWLARQRAAGRTAVDIARELGCSDRAVGKALRAAGITPRRRGGERAAGAPTDADRRLAAAAARARLGVTADDAKAPPLRPQPPCDDHALVVRVDAGWTSTSERAVFLVEPHHTLHDLAMTVVALLAFDADQTHLGVWLLPPDGRIRRPGTDGYWAHLHRSEPLHFSAAACHPVEPLGYFAMMDLERRIAAPAVAEVLGVGTAAWLIWDLGDRERFSVRVLAGAPAGELSGLGAPSPQGIYIQDPSQPEGRYDTARVPDRWCRATGSYRFDEPDPGAD